MASQIRGPYKKGLEKRREILNQAMQTFSKVGYHATSMREIAKDCGLTQPGLLHHFPSKAALLMAIIAERNERQGLELLESNLGVRSNIMLLAKSNLENRTETLLFSTLAAEAEDPSHPAHEFMRQRYSKAVDAVAKAIAGERGHALTNVEVRLARVLIAAWDGLQLQWLMDESYDMLPELELVLDLVAL